MGITGITDGSQPYNKKVAFRWEIDWDKAPDDLKVCFPRFELAGNELALFELKDLDWIFISYLRPEEAGTQQVGASALDKLK